MPLPAQLDIYKASAGSGKTYLLTSKYLQLVLENPSSYRHILAVTFTNKATAEMKKRILSEMEKLASGQGSKHEADLLRDIPGMHPDLLQERAADVYKAILHDYSRFAISTIDSFVQGIIRSFAFEIGLDAGFKLQLNTDVVKEELADRLFRLLDTDEGLRHWVADLALQRLTEGRNWNFRDDMLQLASELFKEQFQAFEQSLAKLDDTQAAFKSLRDNLETFVRGFEKRWTAVGTEAMNLLAANGLVVDDFPYKRSGFIGYFVKAADGKVEKYGSRVTDALADTAKMGGKKNPAIAAIENDIDRLLRRLCGQCDDELSIYMTAQALKRNIGNLRLMQVFARQLGEYRSEENLLLISDTHLLLRQLTRETDANFIYEKTGNRFRHYLIDEFQDTSIFQWDNFRPLLENALAEGNFNLVVGDVKQAIYRWRSGDWQLLHQQVKNDLSALPVTENSLQHNYRSHLPVVSFNNFLFYQAPRLLQQQFSHEIQKAPESVQPQLAAAGFGSIITTAYKEYYQFWPENEAKRNGLVDIQFLECEKDQTYGEVMQPKLFDTIAALLAEGFAPGDIAILTRKNPEATSIIEYLVQHQEERGGPEFTLISADALLLANNNTVCVLLRAISILAGDKSKFALVHLRQALALHQQREVPNEWLYFGAADKEKIVPQLFFAKLKDLRRLPLPELVSQLITLFDLNRHDKDAAYLLAFQDLVNEWSRFGNDGLQKFLQYWEDEGKKVSVKADDTGNAISVQTIHKSKGLEFKVVILPYLNWEIKPDAKKTNQLWVKTENTLFNEVPIVPVRYSSALESTDFAFSYFEEMLMGMMDNLNLLYVATTRAVQRLIGFAPDPEKLDNLNTMEKLLKQVLTAPVPQEMDSNKPVPGNETDPGNENWMVVEAFDPGENRLLFGVDEKTPAAKKEEKATSMPKLVQSYWQDRLTVQVKTLVTETDDSNLLPRELGVLMHEAMALLKRPDAIEPVIRQMAQRGVITPSQQQNLRATLQEFVALPLLKDWVDGRLHRLSERAIIGADRQLKRPDLVLYNGQQTLVIDFKFTTEKVMHQRYEKQVSEYMQLLSQIGFTHISGWLLYAGEHIETIAVNP